MALYKHERPGKGATDVWLTPQSVIQQLGPFDLDPCAATDRPWDTAKHHFTAEDDGLAQDWFGFVWLNPPYSDVWTWLAKLAEHGNGIAFIFARTETRGFHEQVWGKADAIAFPKGRFEFHRADGTPAGAPAGAPSCFVAYGAYAHDTLVQCLDAPVVTGWR